jgi:hypothetical protein
LWNFLAFSALATPSGSMLERSYKSGPAVRQHPGPGTESLTLDASRLSLSSPSDGVPSARPESRVLVLGASTKRRRDVKTPAIPARPRGPASLRGSHHGGARAGRPPSRDRLTRRAPVGNPRAPCPEPTLERRPGCESNAKSTARRRPNRAQPAARCTGLGADRLRTATASSRPALQLAATSTGGPPAPRMAPRPNARRRGD